MRVGEIPATARMRAPLEAHAMTATDTSSQTGDLGLDLSRYKLGWSDEENYVFKPKKGLSDEIVREMSWMKGEPKWMLDNRLKSLRHFEKRPMPTWGGDMSQIFFDDIYYYIKPTEQQVDAWEDLPHSGKETYEMLGIPEPQR